MGSLYMKIVPWRDNDIPAGALVLAPMAARSTCFVAIKDLCNRIVFAPTNNGSNGPGIHKSIESN